MNPSALQRISIRWLPEPVYEDTETIALNVGGYFVDLRVNKKDATIQWSRAGERILLQSHPRKSCLPLTGILAPILRLTGLLATFRWTHIIDSLDLTVPDEAYFKKLPNGDDLEIGTTPCPFKGGVPTNYEEVWRDVTSTDPGDFCWILQSADGMTFLGRVGSNYLAIQKELNGGFAARKEDCIPSEGWQVAFESDAAPNLPLATAAIEAMRQRDSNMAAGDKIDILGRQYVIKGVQRT
jgi:hypothetical protein